MNLKITLLQLFKQFFKDHSVNNPQHYYLVAVSGGMDSSVLCHLCHEASLNFSVAHCNFGLRGKESERDEAFVRALGEKYAAEVFVKKFDTEKYATEKKLSVQEAARELRYQWFYELKSEKGFNFILLAHHADDNIETLLMNFFRGTGLKGLKGIPEKGKGLLRPLLHINKMELEAYAAEKHLKWVEDSSNDSNKYTRNFFRNELIPAIKKAYPQAEDNLLDNISRFNQIDALYELTVGRFKKDIIKKQGNEIHIPVKKLLQYQNTSLLFEIIKEYGFAGKQVDELLKLSDAESGRYIQSDSHRIIKHRHWFIIAAHSGPSETIIINEEDRIVHTPNGVIEIKKFKPKENKVQASGNVAILDAKEIEYPLLLRRWKQGDYFYPLGMRKKKKLGRFFIDQKLSKTAKENIWVLESTNRILWVVGQRIDDRFKVTEKTKESLLLNWTNL